MKGNVINWSANFLALVMITGHLQLFVDAVPRLLNSRNYYNRIDYLSESLEENVTTSPNLLVASFGFASPVLNSSQLVCLPDRMIDQFSLMHAQICLGRIMREQELSLFTGSSSVLNGNLTAIIQRQCGILRQMQTCASRVFTFISECVGNGDEFVKMLNAQIKFICEADYSVTKESDLASELREGFNCLSKHKEQLKTCIKTKSDGNAKLSDNMQGELRELSLRGITQIRLVPGGRTKNEKICQSLGVIDECFSEQLLGRCSTPAPEHVLTSMYLKVGQALHCDVTMFARNKRHWVESLVSHSSARMMQHFVNGLSF